MVVYVRNPVYPTIAEMSPKSVHCFITWGSAIAQVDQFSRNKD